MHLAMLQVVWLWRFMAINIFVGLDREYETLGLRDRICVRRLQKILGEASRHSLLKSCHKEMRESVSRWYWRQFARVMLENGKDIRLLKIAAAKNKDVECLGGIILASITPFYLEIIP